MRARSGHLHVRDGLRLPTRAWLPDEGVAPRAQVVLVHGLGEHVGRHEGLALRLVRAGYEAHGYDQRGHGYAPGPRAQVDRFERFVDDLADFVAGLEPALPLVLFGQSMGGVTALRAVQSGAVAPAALVLSSPALRDGVDVPAWVRALLMRVSELWPGVPTVPLDTAALSRDPDEVAAYRLDPAVFHGPIKGRIGSEIVRHGRLALAEADRVRVPLLILHGKEDRLTQPGASAELQRALHGRDATLLLYDDGPHELFHDALRERATGDLLAWLDARLPPRG